MNAVEANADGLIGPTHSYAGLSPGNLASSLNKGEASNPRAAVLQGLDKMKLLADLGLPQFVLPPHERPDIPFLRSLGFAGTDGQVLERAWRTAPSFDFKAARDDELFVGSDRFIGQLVTDVMPPDVASRTMEAIETALATNEVQVFEYDLTPPGGEQGYFEARVVASGSDEALAIVRNITDRKLGEQRLRESENRYRTIFHTTGAAMVSFSDDGVIQLANEEWVSITGMTREELEGNHTWMEFFPPDQLAFMMEYHRKRAKDPGGVPRRYEAQILDKDGHRRDGIVTIDVVPGTHQRVASFLDISERKRSEQQMAQAEKMAALGQIIAGVAHEINNPNNFITFNLPILKKYVEAIAPILNEAAERDPELRILNMNVEMFLDDTVKLLSNMSHGSERITGIVSELKTYIRSHEADEEKKPRRLSDVMGHVMNLVGKQVRKQVRTFDVRVPDNLPPVRMNAGKIEQVLINLIINAGQAADKDDAWVRVTADAPTDEPGFVTLVVADNGAGIPDDIRRRIFDPFFTTKSRESGTGLGLSISSRIVEEHGGTIVVESTEGEGATFIVRLPICEEEVA